MAILYVQADHKKSDQQTIETTLRVLAGHFNGTIRPEPVSLQTDKGNVTCLAADFDTEGEAQQTLEEIKRSYGHCKDLVAEVKKEEPQPIV